MNAAKGPEGARGPDGIRTPDEGWDRVVRAFELSASRLGRRWYHRWRTQGFLLTPETPEGDHPYQAKFFILERSARRFQRRLHRDHGPGMLRTECKRVSDA